MPSKLLYGKERRLDLLAGKKHESTAFSPRLMKAAEKYMKIDITRYCAPVRDQGQEGSCASFMGAGLIEDRETALFVEHGGEKPVERAEQFIYYFGQEIEGLNHGDDTGLTIEAVQEELEKYGAPAETSWPYPSYDPTSTLGIRPPDSAIAEALGCRALLSTWATTVEEIKAALLVRYSVGFGMELPSIYEDPAVTSTGMLPYDVTHGFIGGHAQRIVGCDDTMNIDADVGAFLVQNQWSEAFGMAGRIWVPYRYWREGVCSSNLVIHRVSL